MDEMAEQMAFWSGAKQAQNPNQLTQGTSTGPSQMAPAQTAQAIGGLGTYLGYPSSGTVTATGFGGQYFQYPAYPTASVPIYPYDSKEGILLTDKEGKQHFVPIRDIAQSIGLEW